MSGRAPGARHGAAELLMESAHAADDPDYIVVHAHNNDWGGLALCFCGIGSKQSLVGRLRPLVDRLQPLVDWMSPGRGHVGLIFRMADRIDHFCPPAILHTLVCCYFEGEQKARPSGLETSATGDTMSASSSEDRSPSSSAGSDRPNEPAKGAHAAKPVIVYVDGIFDLFHAGHINFLKQAKALGGPRARLLVGVIQDDDARWKREPFVKHADRVCVVKHCNVVDAVIEDPPLVLDEGFLDALEIDLVVHGDDSKQEEFFKVPIARGIMRYTAYTSGISTTAIAEKISARALDGTLDE